MGSGWSSKKYNSDLNYLFSRELFEDFINSSNAFFGLIKKGLETIQALFVLLNM